MAKESGIKETAEEKANHYGAITRNHGWLYGLVGLIILLLVFMAGLGIANHDRWGRNVNFVSKSSAMPLERHGRFMMGDGGFGNNTTINGQSRDEGVVTSVSGSSFTLAGHGATTSVTTNSSTQYQGGNTVKQNDTVVVWGTESNGTLTATAVSINP